MRFFTACSTRLIEPTRYLKCLLLLLLFITNLSHASSPFYLGGIVGPGINYFTSDKDYVAIRNAEHATFAWNLFTGVNLSERWALELGYLNLGFYENSGNGQSICDTNGNCGYPKTVPFKRFQTKLTVVNDITPQFYYFDTVFLFLKTEHFRFFTKVGIAYNDVQLKSYVDVFPNIDNIGIDIQQTITSKNSTLYSAHVALGYEYQANDNIFLRSEVDYFDKKNMISQDDGSSEGTLYPIAILFGTRILF